jgi:hypothetical protein
MSLLQLQTAFRAEIAASDDRIEFSSTGMDIYRDAYRGRLLGALEASFEHTRRWTGAEAFTAAACHYVLTTPPRAWTIDLYGAGFPDLLGTLFADDLEVAELAWLEWQMQCAFAAPDANELDALTLAAAGHTDADWDRLGFDLAAGFASRPITTNAPELWTALAKGNDGIQARQTAGEHLLVWRSRLSPRFRVAGETEFLALQNLALGATLGDIAQGTEAPDLAGWLSQWLDEGIFAGAVLRR